MLSVLITSLIWIGGMGAWTSAVAEVDTFRAADHASLMEQVPAEKQRAFEEALISSGSNWPELMKAMEGATSEEVRKAVVELILGIPPADRAEATSAILLDHAGTAVLARGGVPYPVPEDPFVKHVLNFRLDFEPVEGWRHILFENVFPLVKGVDSASEAAQSINRWVAGHTEVRRSQEAVRQTPLVTLREGRGGPTDLCILLGAALRAACIPARMIYAYALGEEQGQGVWIEAVVDGAWIPLYPSHPEAFGDVGWMERDHPHNLAKVTTRHGPYWEDRGTDESLEPAEDRTAEYTDVGWLEATVDGLGKKEYLVLSVFNRGSWIPIVRGKPGTFVLGDGEVLVTVGRPRVHIVTRRVTIHPGEVTILRLALPSQ